jgi:3-isopropylmalate dehydratase small subunit
MSNMMGGGGDLMDSLLGGSSDATGMAMVEGDVKFVVDARFNHIWVRGATENDLITINTMVERLDQPEGETKPEVDGKTRIIEVLHRDAEVLVGIIKEQRAAIMFNENAQKGQKANNEIAQMAQAVQSLTGKKNNAASPSSEAMKPKVKVTADTVSNQILVTGPEYLFKEIQALVLELDIPQGKRSTEIIPNVPPFLLNSLMQQNPSKLKMGTGEEDTGGAKAPGATAANSNQSAADKARAQQQQQMQQQMQRAIQQRIQQSRQQGGAGGARGGRPTGGRGGRGGR